MLTHRASFAIAGGFFRVDVIPAFNPTQDLGALLAERGVDDVAGTQHHDSGKKRTDHPKVLRCRGVK